MGAGLSLILAGSVALMLVSALVAFNGWAGPSVERTADEQALVAAVAAHQRTDGQDAGAVAAVRLPVPAAPAPVRRAAARTTVRATHVPQGTAGLATHAAATPVRHAAAVPAASAGAATPAPAPAPAAEKEPLTAKVTVPDAGEGVRKLGTGLDTTVTNTGAGVAHLVEPALPTVAPIVASATGIVGDVLNGVTAVVGQVVDGLVKPKQ